MDESAEIENRKKVNELKVNAYNLFGQINIAATEMRTLQKELAELEQEIATLENKGADTQDERSI